MKWRGRRTSGNIEDRRGGGGRRVARAGGGIGLVGLLAILAGLYFGIDVRPFLGLIEGGGQVVSAPAGTGPNRISDGAEEFVAVVLADTEEVWAAEFRAAYRTYERPTLVLYSGVTRSACGTASAAVGPFYCPGDRQIYLDTDFFATLETRLGARGDFAKAYVIAHEVAHHVQNLLGVMERTAPVIARGGTEANRVSVMTELQADCLAGLWANRAERLFGSLEPGDIQEALDAAARIGDDALQQAAQGYVVPDSFTHGSSEQRARWFLTGYREGRLSACDTFSAERL